MKLVIACLMVASIARPLVGFYDSSNQEVTKWHVQLTKRATAR